MKKEGSGGSVSMRGGHQDRGEREKEGSELGAMEAESGVVGSIMLVT